MLKRKIEQIEDLKYELQLLENNGRTELLKLIKNIFSNVNELQTIYIVYDTGNNLIHVFCYINNIAVLVLNIEYITDVNLSITISNNIGIQKNICNLLIDNVYRLFSNFTNEDFIDIMYTYYYTISSTNLLKALFKL